MQNNRNIIDGKIIHFKNYDWFSDRICTFYTFEKINILYTI